MRSEWGWEGLERERSTYRETKDRTVGSAGSSLLAAGGAASLAPSAPAAERVTAALDQLRLGPARSVRAVMVEAYGIRVLPEEVVVEVRQRVGLWGQ